MTPAKASVSRMLDFEMPIREQPGAYPAKPLELGEEKKDIQRQPSHAGGGGELLGDRHERDAAAVKDLDELGKIEERARSLLQIRHQQL